MEVSYYNLAGGINMALTQTELGLDTKRVFWSDAENVEILQNRGIVKQKGNSLFLELPHKESISGLCEMKKNKVSKLVITTTTGNIYVYNKSSNILQLLEKKIKGERPAFAKFLDGVLVSSLSDSLFYIKNNDENEVVECNLNDIDGNPVYSNVIGIYKGRVWVADNATIYYSALGTYDDFTTEGDAGYIRNFHTNTDAITALYPYKDYLAIYKKDSIYLLSGISGDDFAVMLFAQKGALSPAGIVNVENKQYFLSNGIFSLEEVGELNQIQLGSEISYNISPEFLKLNTASMDTSLAVHYEIGNQVWFFMPYPDDVYFHIVWIYDYINKAWYKRKIPQNITTACIFDNYILSADTDGKIYRENYGTTFNGQNVKFFWKSPFFALNSPHKRKIIDEFYFILDAAYDNDFNFSVYKDYDKAYPDDREKLVSIQYDHLLWAGDESPDITPYYWASDEVTFPVWSVNKDFMEKLEISESNYSIQLCVEGEEVQNSCAIIGLQFREIYNDD